MTDDLTQQPTVDEPHGQKLGEEIGPYRLLQRIGEGGFGSVYEAEQLRPVRRRVALKVIKLGMDTEQVIARFEAERQALAMMDHPHIAHVLDAGATPTGRPFFVMEMVKGAPITEYCDRECLSIDARLRLFEQVCAAVQHAHTKGIIHRDLKPSNILVATQDGEPVPKVIDFGIAKATATRLTERPLYTELHAMIGTPIYMSPEQAEGSADIDTRTDVYSLGVVLYELLTGTTPIDVAALQGSTLAEVQRLIREVEAPRPSTRVPASTATATIAPARRTEPRRLVQALRGELDWIVMKAIEKDRGRRYETANGLAMDVRRHLAGEPVVAAPPSATYRLGKLVRRHRTAVAAGLLVVATLVAGLVGTTVAMLRADEQRRAAEQVADFMKEIFKGIGPEVARGRDTALLKDLVQQASERIAKGELADSPQAEVELRSSIGGAQIDLAEYAAAEQILVPELERARAVFGASSPEAAQALMDLATLRLEQGRFADAEPLARECLELRRKLLPPTDKKIAEALANLAMSLVFQGRPADGEQLMRDALAILRESAESNPEAMVTALGNLAYALQHQDRTAEAEPVYREALDICRKSLTAPHPYTATVLNNLAVVLFHQKRLPEAEAAYREALELYHRILGDDHPKIAATLTGLAAIAQAQERYEEAEGFLRKAVAISKGWGPTHPNVGIVTSRLVAVLVEERKLAEAESFARELVAIEDANRPGSPGAARARITLGKISTDLGRYAEAESALTAAETTLAAAKEADPALRAECAKALATLYGKWGKPDLAAEWERRASSSPAEAPGK